MLPGDPRLPLVNTASPSGALQSKCRQSKAEQPQVPVAEQATAAAQPAATGIAAAAAADCTAQIAQPRLQSPDFILRFFRNIDPRADGFL